MNWVCSARRDEMVYAVAAFHLLKTAAVTLRIAHRICDDTVKIGPNSRRFHSRTAEMSVPTDSPRRLLSGFASARTDETRRRPTIQWDNVRIKCLHRRDAAFCDIKVASPRQSRMFNCILQKTLVRKRCSRFIRNRTQPGDGHISPVFAVRGPIAESARALQEHGKPVPVPFPDCQR